MMAFWGILWMHLFQCALSNGPLLSSLRFLLLINKITTSLKTILQSVIYVSCWSFAHLNIINSILFVLSSQLFFGGDMYRYKKDFGQSSDFGSTHGARFNCSLIIDTVDSISSLVSANITNSIFDIFFSVLWPRTIRSPSDESPVLSDSETIASEYFCPQYSTPGRARKPFHSPTKVFLNFQNPTRAAYRNRCKQCHRSNIIEVYHMCIGQKRASTTFMLALSVPPNWSWTLVEVHFCSLKWRSSWG